MSEYHVYIMSNKARMLYVGVTNNIERHILEHKMKILPGFTKRFNLTRLVYCESTDNAIEAIEREKEIKSWVRRKKTALINSLNPEWKDLSEELLPPDPDILRYAQDDTENKSSEEWLPPNPDILRCAQDDTKDKENHHA
jgi:putative endonuclease